MTTDAKREAVIAALFVEFGFTEPVGAPVVEAADALEAGVLAGTFDHLAVTP